MTLVVERRIRKMGTSLVLVIPQFVVEALKLERDMSVQLEVLEDGALRVVPGAVETRGERLEKTRRTKVRRA